MSGVLTDACDGSVFKTNALCMQPGVSLKLILYQDAFEVVNPLGSARAKSVILRECTLHLPTLRHSTGQMLNTCSFCAQSKI